MDASASGDIGGQLTDAQGAEVNVLRDNGLDELEKAAAAAFEKAKAAYLNAIELME